MPYGDESGDESVSPFTAVPPTSCVCLVRRFKFGKTTFPPGHPFLEHASPSSTFCIAAALSRAPPSAPSGDDDGGGRVAAPGFLVTLWVECETWFGSGEDTVLNVPVPDPGPGVPPRSAITALASVLKRLLAEYVRHVHRYGEKSFRERGGPPRHWVVARRVDPGSNAASASVVCESGARRGTPTRALTRVLCHVWWPERTAPHGSPHPASWPPEDDLGLDGGGGAWTSSSEPRPSGWMFEGGCSSPPRWWLRTLNYAEEGFEVQPSSPFSGLIVEAPYTDEMEAMVREDLRLVAALLERVGTFDADDPDAYRRRAPKDETAQAAREALTRFAGAPEPRRGHGDVMRRRTRLTRRLMTS